MWEMFVCGKLFPDNFLKKTAALSSTLLPVVLQPKKMSILSILFCKLFSQVDIGCLVGSRGVLLIYSFERVM